VASFVPSQAPLFARTIDLDVVEEPDGRTPHYRRQLSNQSTISAMAPDHEVLLASIFPGVTSDLDAEHGLAHRDVVKQDPRYSLPGMGLYVLTTTVTDVFHGAVTVRTGHHRMTIRKRETATEARQHVKITVLAESATIAGNQITIRIPQTSLHGRERFVSANAK
jgi:hypothetical protein